ncbi:hypothetical protein QCA50_010659 [Cerrena zonata]|uniref:Uncharacterized protein n=1 Tax=Cerrena zonata TaxID=2478898 RepID=A0AAW0G5J9_9APHY
MAIKSLEDEVQELRRRIISAVSNVNDIHPVLERELLEALETLPPLLDAEREARFDVLTMTIETCLFKLSLMRARAQNTLYNHRSATNPEATMVKALTAVHRKLQQKKEVQQSEERELDRQIKEYEDVMKMVDGRGRGGFGQVVEDMVRTKKDIEECRRDLRRLGWTGD